MTKLRFLFAVLLLTISISLLVWSYWPAAREMHVLELPAAELSLPTP
jgi:hypothetical protein